MCKQCVRFSPSQLVGRRTSVSTEFSVETRLSTLYLAMQLCDGNQRSSADWIAVFPSRAWCIKESVEHCII